MSKLETNFLASEERLSLIRDHKLEKDGRKRDRMKFILLYNDGWSYAQIAKVLLLNDQTLRNYLYSVQNKIRRFESDNIERTFIKLCQTGKNNFSLLKNY